MHVAGCWVHDEDRTIIGYWESLSGEFGAVLYDMARVHCIGAYGHERPFKHWGIDLQLLEKVRDVKTH